jgi:hypothetical protein
VLVTAALLPLALSLAALALSGSGCTDGTTPDCSLPTSGCAPDLDGTVGTDAADADAAVDAPDGASDGGTDALDAATRDVALDADAKDG